MNNDILWNAVNDRNISAVEEILRQCTQEILEHRSGKASVYLMICFICLSYQRRKAPFIA